MNDTTPKLTAADKEARRRLAIRKVLSGRTQADVADFLGVHPVTVAKWMRAYRSGGDAAVAAKPVPGRPRFLTDDQEAQVRSWLLRKPTEFGFRTDLWTAARVAQLTQANLGVAFRPSYLREWLSKRVLAAEAGPPGQTARPGGHQCLARPGVSGGPKKVAEEGAHLVLIDETGLFLNPLVRRSWSPVGQTPVIGGDGGHRTKVSVIGAVSVSPVTRRLGFYFATAVGGYFSADKVVAFLRDLLKHLRGKVVVLWDGGPNHKGPVIRQFLRRNRRLR